LRLEVTEDGQTSALAIALKTRIPTLPGLPTVSGYGTLTWKWYGIVAPAKSPNETILQLAGWFAACVAGSGDRRKASRPEPSTLWESAGQILVLPSAKNMTNTRGPFVRRTSRRRDFARWAMVGATDEDCPSPRMVQCTVGDRDGSFATDHCAMKIGPCPQCPESDGWPSKLRRDGPRADILKRQEANPPALGLAT